MASFNPRATSPRPRSTSTAASNRIPDEPGSGSTPAASPATHQEASGSSVGPMLPPVQLGDIVSVDVPSETPTRTERLGQDLDTYFQPLVDRGLFNGAVLIHDIKSNESVSKGYGRTVEGAPIGIDTPMPIGSNTKQLTAGGTMILQAMGHLNVSDKVSDHLPDFSHKDVTIADLLTHHSGLPYEGDVDSMDQDSDEVSQRKGTFEYSNLGYKVLSEVTVAVAKKHDLIPDDNATLLESWNGFMQEYVFEPLNMSDTYCVSEPGRKQWGYEAPSNPEVLVSPGEPDLASVGASGNALTSSRDWAKWTTFLHGDKEWQKPGVPAEVSQAMKKMATEMATEHESHDEKGVHVGHGYGLRIEGVGDQLAIGHGGLNMGVLSESRFFVQDGIMVTVISNVEDTPLPHKVVPELRQLANGAGLDEVAGFSFPESVSYDAETFREFEGVYTIPGRRHPTVTLSIEDNQLYAQFSHPRLGMLPRQEVTQEKNERLFIKQGLQTVEFSQDPVSLTIGTAIKPQTYLLKTPSAAIVSVDVPSDSAAPKPNHQLRGKDGQPGKNVWILCGLINDVKEGVSTQDKFLKSLDSPASKLSTSEKRVLVKEALNAHAKLLAEMNKEFEALLVNPEFATDEFVSLEIGEMATMQATVVAQQAKLTAATEKLRTPTSDETASDTESAHSAINTLHDKNGRMIEAGNQFLAAVSDIYSDDSTRIHCRLDGDQVTPEKLDNFLSKQKHGDVPYDVTYTGDQNNEVVIRIPE